MRDEAFGNQRQPRRVGRSRAHPRQSVEQQPGGKTVGKKRERQRADAGEDAAGEKSALGAVTIGDKTDREQRDEVADVPCRLHHAGLARRHVPVGFQQWQRRGVGGEDGYEADAAQAQFGEPRGVALRRAFQQSSSAQLSRSQASMRQIGSQENTSTVRSSG